MNKNDIEKCLIDLSKNVVYISKIIVEINNKLDILKEEVERINYEEWKNYENEYSGPPPDSLW